MEGNHWEQFITFRKLLRKNWKNWVDIAQLKTLFFARKVIAGFYLLMVTAVSWLLVFRGNEFKAPNRNIKYKPILWYIYLQATWDFNNIVIALTYPFSQSNPIRYLLKAMRWFHVVFRKTQSHDSQGNYRIVYIDFTNYFTEFDLVVPFCNSANPVKKEKKGQTQSKQFHWCYEVFSKVSGS